MTNRNQTNKTTVSKQVELSPFIARGSAYIRGLDEKQNKKTGEFLTTCQLAVVTSPVNAEKNQYQFVNVIVVGAETQDLIWEYEQDLNAQKSVLIEFCISGIRPNAYQRADNTLGASLNAHLFAIEKVWVNNELTYNAEPKAEEQAASASNASSEPVPPVSKRGSQANNQTQAQPQTQSSNNQGSGSRRQSKAA